MIDIGTGDEEPGETNLDMQTEWLTEHRVSWLHRPINKVAVCRQEHLKMAGII